MATTNGYIIMQENSMATTNGYIMQMNRRTDCNIPGYLAAEEFLKFPVDIYDSKSGHLYSIG